MQITARTNESPWRWIRTHVCLSPPSILTKWVTCRKADFQICRKSWCLSSRSCTRIWLRTWRSWRRRTSRAGGAADVCASLCQPGRSEVSDSMCELPQYLGLYTGLQSVMAATSFLPSKSCVNFLVANANLESHREGNSGKHYFSSTKLILYKSTAHHLKKT